MTGASTGPVLDVCVPTRGRAPALAVTLAGLAGQTLPGFRVLLSDQTAEYDATADPTVASAVGVLRRRGHPVCTGRHLPGRGMAEHRAHLLDWSTAPYLLFLDDDVLLEPEVLARLLAAIRALGCGFVGAAVQGLSYAGDVRPADHRHFELWEGPVRPERVRKGEPAWERWRLHNGATMLHLTAGLGLAVGQWRPYKVAWVGGCVLYDRAALLAAGGFDFWPALPANSRGEDVVAQLRVMERSGGAGIVPSGAYHLELPSTLVDRRVDAYAVVLEDDPSARL